MVLPPKVVSAPGKVLLAGGYLVLDQEYTGLVFGLKARVHVYVKPLPVSEGVRIQEIFVKSPQFIGAEWRYGYHSLEKGAGMRARQLTAGTTFSIERNVFIETALSYALTYISAIYQPVSIDPAWVTVMADDDYYSPPETTKAANRWAGEGKFTDYGVPFADVKKTGLGSSAALVTAFIGAILSHYLEEDEFDLKRDRDKKRLHNLAQVAHSAAQDQIGSGFDVAAAVYSSCVYKRFNPKLIESLGDFGSPKFASRLRALVEETEPHLKWDMSIDKEGVAIPKGLRLVMSDVNRGSKTPGMVKPVLAWRQANKQDADRIWKALQTINEKMAQELVRLCTDDKPSFFLVRQYIQENRALVQEMGRKSGCAIEPQEQTDLLNACFRQPGVVGGMCPGAGGYDALVLITVDKQSIVEKLDELFASWDPDAPADEISEIGENPVRRKISKIRLLDTREEPEGVRMEDPEDYHSWIKWPREYVT